ncbi:MAG: FAD:protein FMN transferase [Rhodobacteraceae bacterium]|nr:FAD:protein FMN transferase [Paracoccaceae bacterium]
MSLSRRHFLALSACGIASKAFAQGAVQRWRGRALGADLRLDVVGASRADIRRLWKDVAREVGRIEAHFSLYQASDLGRLNETGLLMHPSSRVLELFRWADRLHKATNGVFDPTVQALWLAHADGLDVTTARERTGWDRVKVSQDRISLAPGMALTFNGIAQGYAADRVAALVRRAGFENALVDMGEIRALGRGADSAAWRVGIAGPSGDLLDTVELENRALATSSPGATRVGRDKADHIMHPQGRSALWRTVAVSAPQAVLADGLSTAFCLMERKEITASLEIFQDLRVERLD